MGCVGGSNGLAQRTAKQAWLLLPPDPRLFQRRQRGRPLRPRAQVRALLKRHARLCEAAARNVRPLRGAARVHAQGRDLCRFAPLDEQENAGGEEPP